MVPKPPVDPVDSITPPEAIDSLSALGQRVVRVMEKNKRPIKWHFDKLDEEKIGSISYN